eukprot:1824136-Prymnesium_polylepis.1
MATSMHPACGGGKSCRSAVWRQTSVQPRRAALQRRSVPSLEPEASMPSASHARHLTPPLWPVKTVCVALGSSGHE